MNKSLLEAVVSEMDVSAADMLDDEWDAGVDTIIGDDEADILANVPEDIREDEDEEDEVVVHDNKKETVQEGGTKTMNKFSETINGVMDEVDVVMMADSTADEFDSTIIDPELEAEEVAAEAAIAKELVKEGYFTEAEVAEMSGDDYPEEENVVADTTIADDADLEDEIESDDKDVVEVEVNDNDPEDDDDDEISELDESYLWEGEDIMDMTSDAIKGEDPELEEEMPTVADLEEGVLESFGALYENADEEDIMNMDNEAIEGTDPELEEEMPTVADLD